MIVLQPEKVTFDGQVWDGVESIAIDRLAQRLTQEWGDAGPHMVFVDVPEQRVRVSLVQRLDDGALDTPTPGTIGLLRFETSRSAGDAGRLAVQATVVVGEVRHEVTRKGGLRSVVLWAVSSDGSSDPITVGGAA